MNERFFVNFVGARYLRGDLIRVCHEYRQLSVTTVANVKTFLGIFHQLQLDSVRILSKYSVILSFFSHLQKRQAKGIGALGKFLDSMQPDGGHAHLSRCSIDSWPFQREVCKSHLSGLPAQLKGAEEEHKKYLPRMLSHQRYTYFYFGQQNNHGQFLLLFISDTSCL